MGHSSYAMLTDLFHLISDLISFHYNYFLCNNIKYAYKFVILYLEFSGYHCMINKRYKVLGYVTEQSNQIESTRNSMIPKKLYISVNQVISSEVLNFWTVVWSIVNLGTLDLDI